MLPVLLSAEIKCPWLLHIRFLADAVDPPLPVDVDPSPARPLSPVIRLTWLVVTPSIPSLSMIFSKLPRTLFLTTWILVVSKPNW